MTKRCTKCGQTRPFEDFGADRRRNDGKQSWSRNCTLQSVKAYKRANYEAVRDANNAASLRRYHLGRSQFVHARATAKRLGREWTISKEDWERLTEEGCHYCGCELPKKAGSGLDRIDNDRGYHLDNVLPCCTICNKVRGNWFSVRERELVIGPAISQIMAERESGELELPQPFEQQQLGILA